MHLHRKYSCFTLFNYDHFTCKNKMFVSFNNKNTKCRAHRDIMVSQHI